VRYRQTENRLRRGELHRGRSLCFQDGEVDERAQTSPMGTSTGNVSHPASGIRKHVVFDIGGEERNISGKWAETDAVELLA
jgi:hypothetical protein